jgi:hypothetical protein
MLSGKIKLTFYHDMELKIMWEECTSCSKGKREEVLHAGLWEYGELVEVG